MSGVHCPCCGCWPCSNPIPVAAAVSTAFDDGDRCPYCGQYGLCPCQQRAAR